MAQTRAERTHGRWPVWLPVLALAAAGLWLFSLSWNRVRPGVNMAPATVPQTIYQQRITDLLAITTAPDKRALSGRRVQLGHVQVAGLAGGGAFWIGPEAGAKLLVVPKEPTASTAPLQAGQTPAIIGTLEQPGKALPGGAPTAITPMGRQRNE